jgi:poly(hydroxyalkanoate) granule-associated protein
MTATKRKTKKRGNDSRTGEITEQLEHVFLAGLGALSNAQKAGAKTFDSLVKQGEVFRSKTSKRTESLIEEVQDSIRSMTGDTEAKATGLLNKVRHASNLDKLQSVFDTRVADAMDRLNVPSKNDIDGINKKLNKILRSLDGQRKPAAAATKRKTKKKAATKKVSKK